MPRELVMLLAVASLIAATGCVQSADRRAERAAARRQERAPVRASPTVQRATTPRDSGRILYDAPTDLSDTATRAVTLPSAP